MKPIVNIITIAELAKLLGYLAHEMQTPLATLKIDSRNLCQLVKQPNDLAIASEQLADIQEIAGGIGKQSHYLSHYLRLVVNNLTALTLDKLELETVLLDECIQESLDTYPFRSVLIGDYIEFIGNDQARVVANKFWLKQVIDNLLDNAVYQIQRAGKGSISLEVKESGRRLVITDTGEGIAKEDLDCIFEPFTTVRPNHLGLGLAACRKLVGMFGGRISCQSNPGEFCQFTISLNTVIN